MAVLNLDKLFYPHSVAVIGASNREGSPGNLVMHNLLHGGFEGPIMPVNSRDRAISGVLAYSDVEHLPITPDLAVVCTPEAAATDVIRALGERGTRAAILLSDDQNGKSANGHRDGAILRQAERFGLRLLGPDCLGLMNPGIGLNASVAHVPALPGGVAFVSQSSTICAAVLDWARERDIGFSHFLSLGETCDICFGDVIDYLGSDPMTRAILLCVESIKNGRTFMSAGRGASRNKPILVIKTGRTPESQKLCFGRETPAVTDEVYDAAIRRAGMLRVFGFDELFAAVETLARSKLLRGERLAIIANGHGISVMAVDPLTLNGGRLAQLSPPTLEALRAIVSNGASPGNPLHLDENAPPEQYGAAARVLFADGQVDAVMILHAPTSNVSSRKAAEAVVRAVPKQSRVALLTCWMGGERVSDARRIFAEARVPTFDTPNQAVDAYLHMVRYRRNQEMLIETPGSMPSEFTPLTKTARRLIEDFLVRGGTILDGPDAFALLKTYGIRGIEARLAKTSDIAGSVATEIGFPVTVRVVSTETSSSAVSGVESFLGSPEAVKTAAERLRASVLARNAGAVIDGFQVERVMYHPGAHELLIEVADDAIFGPVIIFGHGGAAASLIGDRAVALPPLNMSLARELISRTRIAKVLKGGGLVPPVNLDALCLTLIQVSQLIVDFPEIVQLRINPLVVDRQGAIAVDAQVLIAPATQASERRLAIRPYPKELEEEYILPNGRKAMIRPIRPEDEPAHHDFIGRCTPEDLRLRFFHLVRSLPHAEMARLTQIDYDREMAFLVTAPQEDGSGPETLGVVRTIADLHNDNAEYAILLRSDMKGHRLGWKLMDKMVRYCRSRGTRKIVGQVLRDNKRMLDLIHSLGFTSRKVPDEDIMEVAIDLQAPRPTVATGTMH